MYITSIEGPVRKKYRVFLNDEPVWLLYWTELCELGLKAGDELSDGQILEIETGLLARRAKNRCMHILEKRDKTEWQLSQQRLKDGYTERSVQAAVDSMKQLGYLDDLRFSQFYIENRKDQKGSRQLTAELMAKGVPEDIIEKALSESEMPGDTQVIRSLMEKKHFRPEEASDSETEQMIRYFIRKGFSYASVKEAMKQEIV